jgi:hypothetical protein
MASASSMQAMIRTDPPQAGQVSMSMPKTGFERHVYGPNAHAPEDLRTFVELPDELRVHMLTNMRDHLLALQQIQEALAGDEFEEAAQIAEQRLGMTSLERHGAHAVGPFMPEAMRMTGTAMHRAASQFAVTASDASATGEVRPALADLARVTAQCVACHEGFRVQ